MTQKPLDEVAVALHDCDYNVDSAVLNLLEGKNDEVMCIFFTDNEESSFNLLPEDFSPLSSKIVFLDK